MHDLITRSAASCSGDHFALPFTRRVAAACAAALLAGAGAAHAQGLPFTESFDNTTFRDTATPVSTTADWGETSAGQLKLGARSPLSSTFEAATAIDLPGLYATRGLALGDMNGDGWLDILEASIGSSGVYINLGAQSGPGAFAERVDFAGASGNARGVAVADMNGDGHLDVVLGMFNDAPSYLLLNSGDGVTYEAQPITSELRATDFVVLGDFNGDGHIDVATANHNQRNRLYLSSGDPLQPFAGVVGQMIGNAAANTQALAAGDIDNDGDLDLVALNENEINHYHFNDGTGLFSGPHDIGTDADDSQDGALADVNGDGWLDLIVANTAAGQANKVYLNAGAPTWLSVPTAIEVSPAGSFNHAHAVIPADIDDDGDIDVVLSTAGAVVPPAEGNRVYINDGTGNFPSSIPIGAEMDMTNTAGVGDLDNDGDLDYVSGNESRDPLGVALPFVNRVYLNAGTSSGATAVPQLRGTATSLRVDAETEPIASVRLRHNGTLGIHNAVEYWISSDGGVNWVTVAPGRPVLVPEAERGQDLRWRAHLTATSPEATLGGGALAIDDVTLELNTSGPVAAAAVGDQAATVGTPFAATALYTDADGDPVRYSLLGLPPGTGLVINPATGEIGGTPTDADAAASPIAVTVVATDSAIRAEETFTLTVTGGTPNNPPAFTSTAVTAATAGTEYVYAVTASDPDGHALTITPVALPAWLALSDNGDGTAEVRGTPAEADVGDHAVDLLVQDTAGGTANQAFTITVAAAGGAPPDQAPTITLNGEAQMTVPQGGTFTDPGATATDPEDGDLTDQITVDNPVDTAAAGTYTVTYTVQDSAGASAQVERTVVVQAAAQNPPSNPPTNPQAGGGGGGGGGSTTLLELLLLGLLAGAGRALGRPRAARS